MKKLTTYIFYYTDKTDYSDGFEVEGIQAFYDALKWLHSDEVKATNIEIYKRGKNFDNDPDDVIAVHQRYWK